jgi:hypothetical protein
VGAAAFEVQGSRADTSVTDMVGHQIVGGAEVGQPVTLIYAGDGHNHWHVKNLAAFKLSTIETRKAPKDVGFGAKIGFCFWDNVRYRSDAVAQFYGSAGCGVPTSLSLTMGLSAGWGDIYPSYLNMQWVDITGLKNGKYRLTGTADASNWFVESSESNNSTWVDLQIKGKTVKVLATGPGV